MARTERYRPPSAAHRFPGALAGLLGQPESDGFVPNVIETGKRGRRAGNPVRTTCQPSWTGVLSIDPAAAPEAHRGSFAKGCGTGLRPDVREWRASASGDPRIVLPLDFHELTLRRRLVGRRSEVKPDTLLLVEPP